LYMKYGLIAHIPRSDAGVGDSCTASGDVTWFGDGVCEGTPAANYKYIAPYKFELESLPPLEYFKASIKIKTSSEGYPYVIASEGLFTEKEVSKLGTCDVGNVSKRFSENERIGSPRISEERISGMKPKRFIEDKVDKIGQGMKTTFRLFIDSFDKHFMDANCDSGSLSVLAQLLNITKPVNITDSRVVMAAVKVLTLIANATLIVFIAFYALMYTTGFENMNPVKFSIRVFACLLIANYLPYLAQDVLNLNNQIVHNVSQLKFSFEPLKDEDGNQIDGVQGTSVDLLAGSLDGTFENLFIEGTGKDELLLLIVIFIVLFFAIIPLLRLVIWWYMRFLKICLMVAIGPFMVMLMALPQSAKYGKKWVNQLIGEIFSQSIIAIGFLLVGLLLSNLPEVSYNNHLGWLGTFFFIMAAAFFMAEMPSFAKSMLDGVTDMGTSHTAGAIKNFGNSGIKQGKDIGKGILKGLEGKKEGKSIAGSLVNKASRGMNSGISNTIKGLKGEERSQKPGLSGLAGYTAGNLLRKSFADSSKKDTNKQTAKSSTSRKQKESSSDNNSFANQTASNQKNERHIKKDSPTGQQINSSQKNKQQESQVRFGTSSAKINNNSHPKPNRLQYDKGNKHVEQKPKKQKNDIHPNKGQNNK